jgi:F-type H+-transporting ATPase subunit epsilon
VAKQLQVELVAVEQKVWTGHADMVIARTTEGELGILPGHAPMLGQLAEPGQVRVKESGGQELAWDVSGGFLSVTSGGVTVLAESAAPADRSAAR